MKTPLRLLIVEDNEDDAMLIARTLEQEGYDLTWERVDTPEAMNEALDSQEWDAVICDYAMPQFSGLDAVKLMQDRGLDDLPAIIVSGSIGEEIAVETMRAGAHDYVMKDNLIRLGAAVRRELQEASNRQKRRWAEAEVERLARFPAEDPSPVLRVAKDGTILYANKASSVLLEAWDCHIGQRLPEYWHRVVSDALSDDATKEVEVELNGDTLLVTVAPILEPGYANLYGRDITAHKRAIRVDEELKAAREIEAKNTELERLNKQLKQTMTDLLASQRRLMQSEKLAALGRLVAGVGHELTNPVMGILNYVQYCGERTPEGDPRHERLVKAVAELHRCQRIIEALRSYAHGSGDVDRPESEQADCRTAIMDTIDLLAQDLRQSDIQITVDAREDLPGIWTDPGAVRQILLNLFTNARDAVAGRERKKITVVAEARNGWIAISVADTGCGMSEEVINRVFDPFFTTKPVGEGTGLGMSVSQNLAKRLGAHIEVESQVDQGTVVTVHLPVDRRAVVGVNQVTGTEGR